MSRVYETIIIGAGIAGLSAAIYARRKEMDFLFLSEDFGGQLNYVGKIENYPGIPQTNWIELAQGFQKQLDIHGIVLQKGVNVTGIVQEPKHIFRIEAGKNVYRAKSVLIATGAHARRLTIPGESKFFERGVHYCAICDGPLYKEKTVAILGSGNAGLEAGEFMMNIAKRVYLIDVTACITGQEILARRIQSNRKVTVMCGTKIVEIFGDKKVEKIGIETDGNRKMIPVDAVLVEIGRVPGSDFVKHCVKLDEHGHIITDKHHMTSVPGVFAAGDVTDSEVYQIITAAGDGAKALINMSKYLTRK